jgi:hypothetical protein
MTRCYVCDTETVAQLLDLGPQPICNRFPTDRAAPQYLYPMRVGQCESCGLVQINDPPPADEIRPRVDWITYSEPEPHLDAMVDRIIQLPGITPSARVCGVSFKDDSTLARFARRGFGGTWPLDLQRDLEVAEAGVGVETIQQRLTPERAARVRDARGASDVIVVRHILEHAHDPRGFLRAIRDLIVPGGYAVFEVPDCQPTLERNEFTTLWEEHTLYVTPSRLPGSRSLTSSSIRMRSRTR